MTTRHRVRLAAVAFGALALCAAYVWRGYFSSDFWEHAAVVRELSARPFSPTHPLLAVDATHAYFSPYLLLLGLIARVTEASPLWVLAAAGLVNVVLLVLAFRRFLVRLLPERGEAAAPYALLFVLFLWGKDAWPWSGFLHIGFLGYAASYPSTFAAAAMFLGLSLLLDALKNGRRGAFVGIAMIVALCVITHPPTAIVLFVGLTALFLGGVTTRVAPSGALLFGSVAVGVVLALAWPYFPVLQLLAAQPPEFHAWSSVFYQDVFGRTWPVLVALPVLLWRLRQCRRDPLVLLVVFLAAIYALGAITGKYGLGRVIASIAVFVQVALGAAMADWESRLPARRAWLAPVLALTASLGLFAYDRPPLPRLLRYERPLWRDLDAILSPVRSGDVVLADSRTSYPVPVLTGGRVVAWRHPVYWVPDHAERRRAQDRFFAAATDDERRAVITRYHVRWIVLNRSEVSLSPGEQARLLALGCVVAEGQSLVLLDLAAVCAAQPRRSATLSNAADPQPRPEVLSATRRAAHEVPGQRVRLSLDAGWRLSLGAAPGAYQPGFDATSWRRVDLPHDWSIEQPPDSAAPGGRNVGFFPTGVGWYRRAFTAPTAWRGQRIALEFEGVYMNAEVWLNGVSLGRHPYGYTPVFYDLTPHLK